jgi:hypothetical protein
MVTWQFWTLLGFLFAMLWWLAWRISEKLDRVTELLEQIGMEMQKEENQGRSDLDTEDEQ